MRVTVEFLTETVSGEYLGDDGKGNVYVELADGEAIWVPDHMVWEVDTED